MFAAMDLNPPHALGFKCTPDEFAAAGSAASARAEARLAKRVPRRR